MWSILLMGWNKTRSSILTGHELHFNMQDFDLRLIKKNMTYRIALFSQLETLSFLFRQNIFYFLILFSLFIILIFLIIKKNYLKT